MDSTKLNFDLESLNKSSNILLIQSLKSSVKSAFLEKFLEGNERPFDKNDFLSTKNKRGILTSRIREKIDIFVKHHFLKKNNVENLINLDYSSIDSELLTLIVILCGQNNSLQPWNSEIIVKNCEVILSEILKFFNCKDVSELLSRNNKINLIKNILQILRSDLTESTWKQFPASIVCYKWILGMIKQPELSQHFQCVLPPALLLTDDFVTENRIIGAQCLNHIVQNITIAELQLYGHGNVIYSALLPLLRIKETDLLYAVVPPLVFVTNKLEFDLGEKDPTKWSKFDSILEIFLDNMELEQKIDLRYCYVNNLNFMINSLGYPIVRWSKRLLHIFDEYVQTAGKYNDEKIINQCLKVIENYIKFSEEVSSMHARHLLFTLLKALPSTKPYANCKSEIATENEEVSIRCVKELLESLSQTEKDNLEIDFKNNLAANANLCMIYKQMFEIHNYFDDSKKLIT